MIERIPTGVPGLDEVLGSGLPANAINLVMGLPGSGKTLLAQQFAFHNATVERPALFLSTVSEPFEKIIAYGQELTFFDREAVGRRVFYDDIGAALLEHGLAAGSARVEELLYAHEPGLLVIDSFKPLAAFASSESDYRRQLHKLAGRLSVRPMTSLWLGEYATQALATAPEFAVADAVLRLVSAGQEEREMRTVQVLKLRGSGFLSGKHAYRLGADGMRVFPRLADPGRQEDYALDRGKASTGVRSLDEILEAGYDRGSATLVVGPTGAGKTVLGLHFVCLGAPRSERSVFATLEENPSQVARAAASFGWSLDKAGVHLMYRSPVDLYLDEWVHNLLELIERTGADRVFVDGLANLRAASADPQRFREYLYSLVQRCSRRGVNLMMSLESGETFGGARVGELPLSQIVDNVMLLHFVRRGAEYRRVMTVVKCRAMPVDPRLREYRIGDSGLALVQQRGKPPH